MNDWNPETYARFRGLRLRPALDLLAQVGALPDGPVVDLGCGNGAVAEALAARWPDHERIGIDTSPAMLAKAADTGCYHRLSEADAALWQPDKPPALIFSNAALQWLSGHELLLPRLARLLAPGGWLAIQMPRQYDAPSHRLMRDLAEKLHPRRFSFAGWQPPVWSAEAYWQMLAPLGRVNLWETEYLQNLDMTESGHPVRRFTESTGMRPFVEAMSVEEADAFVAAYDAALSEAYPLAPDGSVLFPFRRLFITLEV
ncbi:methyltransferase domain-containing protein [Tabrizicola sp. J26]|uniref:methyltransferase domain-containing protein n=1 Tax=Alitabrizicola rongguiensis TaxID=2909234 RepID=UPI001F401536|nr:methyltransferase domain-containing protein [Tabrizicola rongguiensis]MCF1707300.1 methyltransferase domain-containing protein [Tabrizicola rongguiensis]